MQGRIGWRQARRKYGRRRQRQVLWQNRAAANGEWQTTNPNNRHRTNHECTCAACLRQGTAVKVKVTRTRPGTRGTAAHITDGRSNRRGLPAAVLRGTSSNAYAACGSRRRVVSPCVVAINMRGTTSSGWRPYTEIRSVIRYSNPSSSARERHATSEPTCGRSQPRHRTCAAAQPASPKRSPARRAAHAGSTPP